MNWLDTVIGLLAGGIIGFFLRWLQEKKPPRLPKTP